MNSKIRCDADLSRKNFKLCDNLRNPLRHTASRVPFCRNETKLTARQMVTVRTCEFCVVNASAC